MILSGRLDSLPGAVAEREPMFAESPALERNGMMAGWGSQGQPRQQAVEPSAGVSV